MVSSKQFPAIIGLVTAIVAVANPAPAQDASVPQTQDLRTWVERFPVPDGRMRETLLAAVTPHAAEISVFSGESVVGLGIHGAVRFRSRRGLARVVMVDARSREYLVYETYSLIAGSSDVQLRYACRETCLLSPTVPSVLRVELVDASLEIQAVVANAVPTRVSAEAGVAPGIEQIETVKRAQESAIVDLLNRQIAARGLKWIAGETAISRLSYAEKKTLLGCASGGRGDMPNLQGAEYYVGGILEIEREEESPPEPNDASALIPSFDWRSRHGANRPGSPYYDGDPTGGGWMTSIKSQRCADCWAHSALGATEALTNLYFNQHIDADLSEQELVSCSGAGSCRYGGNTGLALAYVRSHGVVDEACFPESGVDEPCGNCCTSPHERVVVAGYDGISPGSGEENIKRKLIASGPLPFGISSWWHAMVLAGYDRDPATGETIWILKNSWGASWGEFGYGYVKVPLYDIYLTYELHHPVTTQSPFNVACNDADGDGFFNWGISAGGSFACGNVPPFNDCDDSDPAVAFLTENGYCTVAWDIETTPPVITTSVHPSILWPPNGRMVPVVVSGTITDAGSGVDPRTASYEVQDEYGRVAPRGPVSLSAEGSYAFTVLLQASRRKYDSDGRQYTITVRAEDRSGNDASANVVVTVPYQMKIEADPPTKGS